VADPEHLARLRGPASVWNRWRAEHPTVQPDLSGADLAGAQLGTRNWQESYTPKELLQLVEDRGGLPNLRRVNFTGANLSGAVLQDLDFEESNLSSVNMARADLRSAHLRLVNLYAADLRSVDARGASFYRAHMSAADMTDADMRGASMDHVEFGGAVLANANLEECYFGFSRLDGVNATNARLKFAGLPHADLSDANFENADLYGATLEGCRLLKTNFRNADLRTAAVYGVSAWDVNLEGAKHTDLIINQDRFETTVTADDLEVAHFLYILMYNPRIRRVLDTITAKVVLILGRFTDERKAVLDALRTVLRDEHNYVPIVFDFQKPASRDLTETILTLAHLSRFVIADITDAKSIPQELSAIVPQLPSVAVQPILLSGASEYAMFEHFRRYPWVLPLRTYDSPSDLLSRLPEILAPAEGYAKAISDRAAGEPGSS
jgi:uncharacterized protein YjbI with pentapeptide repeats